MTHPPFPSPVRHGQIETDVGIRRSGTAFEQHNDPIFAMPNATAIAFPTRTGSMIQTCSSKMRAAARASERVERGAVDPWWAVRGGYVWRGMDVCGGIMIEVLDVQSKNTAVHIPTQHERERGVNGGRWERKHTDNVRRQTSQRTRRLLDLH